MARKQKTIFEVTDVLRMFPTFVWKAELEPEVHRRLNENILSTLHGIRRPLPELVAGKTC